jgi:hypothetical protein|tara:strand:- start:867 stop:1046 length:180 start_codon:yes stop_codon:yes gene_type:complete
MVGENNEKTTKTRTVMGKTKELLEQEWFTESQRAELHWMEEEYLSEEQKRINKNKKKKK